MLPSSGSKSEKMPWTKTRRCFLWVIMFQLAGALVFTLCYSTIQLSLLLRRSLASCNKMTTGCSVAAQRAVGLWPYRFIMDEPHRCELERPFLVLMIPVAPHNREARDAIRDTWAKESAVLGRVVSHYFLLGLSREREGSEVLKGQLLQESRRHHDMLQSDFVDSYRNLTIKTMVMFKWLSSHCPSTSYGMKVDSDMFLNVHKLVSVLLTAPGRLYLTGLVARGSAVHRDPGSKWFMPVSAFPEPTYPPYAMGLGYVFSMDLPGKLLNASVHVRAVYIEDVYVGLCMRHLGIELTDPPHGELFRERAPPSMGDCYWSSAITTVLQDSEQLREVWGIYQTQQQNGC